MDSTLICSTCAYPITSDYNFCPHCGKVLKDLPLSTSITKQIMIYAVSYFLAPMGLRWAIPYLRRNTKKEKLIGAVSLLLTILAIGMLIFTASLVVGQYTKLLNSTMYQVPGYQIPGLTQ